MRYAEILSPELYLEIGPLQDGLGDLPCEEIKGYGHKPRDSKDRCTP